MRCEKITVLVLSKRAGRVSLRSGRSWCVQGGKAIEFAASKLKTKVQKYIKLMRHNSFLNVAVLWRKLRLTKALAVSARITYSFRVKLEESSHRKNGENSTCTALTLWQAKTSRVFAVCSRQASVWASWSDHVLHTL